MVREARLLGVFRERAHSPGRECDDAEILRLTGKELEAKGFAVVLKSPDELSGPLERHPDGVFLMCERVSALDLLAAWEASGIAHVNSPRAVFNTYRDRMVEQFREANVPFIESRFVSTEATPGAYTGPVWVKRADVHNTQEGDVVFADSRDGVARALAALAARGMACAVLQPHVDGDLVKFYGVGRSARRAEPGWFRWFYHKDQTVTGHPLDPGRLAALAHAAATALGLEVYGGDAIATPGGRLTLLDLNAWPSFALYRDEAAPVIASYLVRRFARGCP
jgi:glutathione synthase/RimK-type ligase-like ATP-grasp enzyme